MIVAIDGPSGSGKSSVARLLASRIGFVHLDTGALYRVFTLRALERGPDLRDEAALAALVERRAVDLRPGPEGAHVFLDGRDVTAEIRTPRVTNEIHWLAKAAPVRERVTAIVRDLAGKLDVVADGRDTGTAIFPHADVKFFIDATPEERARRRGLEFAARGTPVAPDLLLAQIRERDRGDEKRAAGPLLRAPDAIYVDTTAIGRDEVVARLAAEVEAEEATVSPGAGSRALYAFLHGCALPTLICWFRFRAWGRENVPRAGGAIIASNHQSFLDPVFFGGAIDRPIDYFARRSLFKGPFGAFIRALNALPVERGKSDVGALRDALERLRAGRILLLFPEGTRTTTGEVGPFEPGVAALARRASVPVVPAAVEGAFDAWPRGRPIFRAGAPCAIALGRPIPPDDPDLVPKLREEVLRLQAFLRRRRPFPR